MSYKNISTYMKESKNKIGIITFHNVINIGAALQASALLKYINSNGEQCELIDFVPNNSIQINNSLIDNLLLKVKRMLKLFTNKDMHKRIMNFSKYQKRHFVLSKKTYYGDEDIRKNPPKYDLLISGSDQILNTTLTGNSTSYYLTFSNNTPKMSYASSFGRDNLAENEYTLISNELSKFDFLSVREASAGEIIEKQIGRKPALVLDPVFLLDKNAWKNISCVNKISPYEKYIFVYSMEQSDSLEKAVKDLKEQTGLPVVVVKGGGIINPIFDFEDKTCGPSEFLRYISDAEYVITNSFHGTAMSLIFEKKFISVAHSTRNARLHNIMSLTSSEDKLVSFSDYDGNVTRYINFGAELYKRLEKYINFSQEYILSAIKHYKQK